MKEQLQYVDIDKDGAEQTDKLRSIEAPGKQLGDRVLEHVELARGTGKYVKNRI